MYFRKDKIAVENKVETGDHSVEYLVEKERNPFVMIFYLWKTTFLLYKK